MIFREKVFVSVLPSRPSVTVSVPDLNRDSDYSLSVRSLRRALVIVVSVKDRVYRDVSAAAHSRCCLFRIGMHFVNICRSTPDQQRICFNEVKCWLFLPV